MNEETAFRREDFVAILDSLGSPGGSIDDVDDDMLEAVVRNRLQLVVDTARIERALLNKSLPLEWRASLIVRLTDLENAKRAVANAAAGRPQVRGALTVRVPPEIALSHFLGIGGRTVMVRADDNGGLVLDLFAQEFRVLLEDRKYGLNWHEANAEAIQQLAAISR
jgi:hypothetical protein